jgi:hypothetical protein
MVLEWDNEPTGRYVFIDKVKDLHPLECSVHWAEVESSFRPRPQDLVAGPFRRDSIPKVKKYDGIRKFGLQYPIPPEQTFWYPVLMEQGNYYGRKLLKSAFMPWYFSLLVHLYANRYYERFGEPLAIGRAPINEDFVYREDGVTKTMSSKQAMDIMLTNVRSGGRIVLPSERDESAANNRSEYTWDIEYLESQMRGGDFERYLARLDEEISLAIFTPMLLMRSGDRGSLNLGVQHTQTWLWALNAMMADLKLYMDAYICERIKAFNFSPKAPRVEWVPRQMGKDNGETLRAIVVAMVTAGQIKPNLVEMSQALGLTFEEMNMLAPLEKTIVNPNEGPDTRERSTRTDRNTGGPATVGSRDAPATTGQ